jgi:hypothetical protein
MSFMEAFGYPSAGSAKVVLLDAVREAGAVRLEADYSGGNDEGGVNEIRIFDAKGEALPVPDSWVERDPKPGDSEWAIRAGKVSEYHPLWAAADAMLSTEFGSWAGEFSAWGMLFADIKEDRVWRDGTYEVPMDERSEMEY